MYNYQTQRSYVFTEEGQVAFLKIRDKAKELLALSGAVTCDKLMCVSGDSWNILACIDRLVEIGELKEVKNPISSAGQHQIYISTKGW